MGTLPTSRDGALARLPDKVLQNVFSRLKPWELLCLARISERIQRISLAIYYDRRGVDVSPTGMIDITREEDYDLLAILRITTFFTRTGHISVIFVFPKWNLMENIRNFTLILRRLVSVDMITLKFRFDPETRISEEEKPAFLAAEARSSRYKGLSKELQALFSAVFRVAGVVRILESDKLLTMVGGDLHSNSLALTRFRINGPPVISKVAAKMGMNKLAKFTSGKKHKGEIERPLPSSSSVVTLDIHLSLLLVPPFLSWTTNSLNFQSQLKHLSFTTAPNDRIHWDQLLYHLYIPSLEQLTLCSSSCTLVDLAKFVKRHVQLSKLDIRDLIPLPAEFPKLASLGFKHLRSLVAPYQFLSTFLQYPADVTPSLEQVHIAASVTEGHAFDLSHVWSTLAPVEKRLHSIDVVGFTMTYEAGESPFDNVLEKGTFTCLIQTLTLRLKADLESQIIGQLTGWIMSFSNLHEVIVESVYPYRYPIQTPLSRKAIAVEEEKQKIKDELAKELTKKLTTMEKLESCEIFGEKYSLE
jgi:hypothetical protein